MLALTVGRLLRGGASASRVSSLDPIVAPSSAFTSTFASLLSSSRVAGSTTMPAGGPIALSVTGPDHPSRAILTLKWFDPAW